MQGVRRDWSSGDEGRGQTRRRARTTAAWQRWVIVAVVPSLLLTAFKRLALWDLVSDMKWNSEPDGWRFDWERRGRPQLLAFQVSECGYAINDGWTGITHAFIQELELPSNRCVKFYTRSLLLIIHNSNSGRRQLAGTVLPLEVHILLMTSWGNFLSKQSKKETSNNTDTNTISTYVIKIDQQTNFGDVLFWTCSL